MPWMITAAACLALVLALAYRHDRRNRDRSGTHDLESAARRARAEDDRHLERHVTHPHVTQVPGSGGSGGSGASL